MKIDGDDRAKNIKFIIKVGAANSSSNAITF